MDEGTTGGGAATVRTRTRPRRRTSVIGVIGEVLITAGVITLLYVVWQLWLGDVIYGAERNAQGHELSEQWAQERDPIQALPDDAEEPAAPVTADPVVLPEPADAETFGVMRVPRFGPDYAVPIAGGVTRGEIGAS